MVRRMMWTAAFALVAIFVVAGAVLDDKAQRTWALASTFVILGAVVIVAIYVAVAGLQRLRTKLERLTPRAFRRR